MENTGKNGLICIPNDQKIIGPQNLPESVYLTKKEFRRDNLVGMYLFRNFFCFYKFGITNKTKQN